MKRGFGFLNAGLVAWCITVGCSGVMQGQDWEPVKETGTVNGFVTTNGVTYVQYTWLMEGNDAVAGLGPLLRDGNDFSFDFDIETLAGGPTPLVFWFENTNVVLGALAPGTYTLISTSWDVPMETNTFTITPVLRAIGFDTNGYFQMQMSSAVTNVQYVLQCSTDFVDWTSLSTNSVSTNSVGVPLTDNSLLLPRFRFYRVLCP